MHFGDIKDCDIANGVGVRITLFVSGCTNKCPGCFQPQTWDFNYGYEYTDETEEKILKMLAPGYIKGLSVLGGEPFEPENQRVIVKLMRRTKELYPEKNIWCYSGFTFEEMKREGSHPRCEVTDEMLSYIDILVDGRFMQEKKNLMLAFRGSENQRIIDMKETLKQGSVVQIDLDR